MFSFFLMRDSGSAASFEGMWQMALTVLLLIVIIVAAFFFTKFAGKFIGKFYAASSGSANTNKPTMKIIDRMFLSRDKMIVLVKIGGKIYIVGVTKNEISPIGSLEEDELYREDKESDKESTDKVVKVSEEWSMDKLKAMFNSAKAEDVDELLKRIEETGGEADDESNA